MNAHDWTDTLTLFGIMVLAENKTRAQEIRSFKKAVAALKDIADPQITVTETMALDWYAASRDQIKTKMSSPYHDETIAALLKNLRPLPQRKALLMAFMKIAMTSDAAPQTEHKIIKQACDSWGLDLAS